MYAAMYLIGFGLGCVAYKIYVTESVEYKVGRALIESLPNDVPYKLCTTKSGAGNGRMKHPTALIISNEDYEHF